MIIKTSEHVYGGHILCQAPRQLPPLRGVAKGGTHPTKIKFVGKLIISDYQATVRMLYLLPVRMLYLLLILLQTSMIYNGIFVFVDKLGDLHPLPQQFSLASPLPPLRGAAWI